MKVLPQDAHNQTLVANAHPTDWTNPTPSGRYNLVAIGGGTAGIIAALGTAGLGGRAALVERHLLGGDCLNFGCVPSKALIRASRIAYDTSRADQFGVNVGDLQVDFSTVMERLRRLRAHISHHDSAERFRSLDVDVHLGDAKFTGPDTLEVASQTLRFRRAVIATGARAFVPPIDGLAEVGYLTNETIFSLTKLPRRLIVIGAGPIGSELGQAMQRLGSDVHMVGTGSTILAKEDPEVAAVVQSQMEKEGIHLHLGSSVIRAQRDPDGKCVVTERDGRQQRLVADEILVAVGRVANVDSLGLEAASVKYNRSGVEVNDRLQTSNRRIYAAGDICTVYKFTHAADAMARICIQNALFFGRKKMSSLVIPRVTYTDPELAHVGMTAADAEAAGMAIDSFRADFSEIDRAIVDSEEDGFAVVHTRKGTGKIVGATIVGSHAGELIGEITVLMAAGKPLGTLAGTIHSYPTKAEVLKRIADRYARTKLTPFVAGLFKKWLAWRR